MVMKATVELIHPESFQSFLLEKLFHSHNVLKYMKNMCRSLSNGHLLSLQLYLFTSQLLYAKHFEKHYKYKDRQNVFLLWWRPHASKEDNFIRLLKMALIFTWLMMGLNLPVHWRLEEGDYMIQDGPIILSLLSLKNLNRYGCNISSWLKWWRASMTFQGTLPLFNTFVAPFQYFFVHYVKISLNYMRLKPSNKPLLEVCDPFKQERER